MKRKITLISIAVLVGLLLAFTMKKQTSSKPLSVGDKVPEFTLLDQNGDPFNSADYLGKNAMVIYFYPKDDTPGCTKEACSFRDSFEEFTDRDVKVIGISADDVKSHLNFAKKYNLPFTLLADTENEVRKLFGVKSNLMGLIPGRVTYVIDSSGNVIYIFESQLNATKHISESLTALDNQASR
jgi:peroxiredoxin Q/BCP